MTLPPFLYIAFKRFGKKYWPAVSKDSIRIQHGLQELEGACEDILNPPENL